MRVLMITSRSDKSGGPVHVNDLCEGLKANYDGKIQIYIASPRQEPFGPKFKAMADAFIDISARRFSVRDFFRLRSFVKQNRIQVCHSHGRAAGLYGRLLSAGRVKSVHTFHYVSETNTFKDKLKTLLDRSLRKRTDRFICVSNTEKERALTKAVAIKGRISVINNGINLFEIRSRLTPEKRLEVRREWQVSDEMLCFSNLSRLDHSQKGIDLLIKGVAFLKENFRNDFRVQVAGEGSFKKEFEKLAVDHGLEKHLFFIGQTSDPISFLNASDYYISFARGEGLPYSVLEAMACNLPCLLSDRPGHQDMVDKDWGLLFNPDDPEDFFKAFQGLYTHPELRESILQKVGLSLESNFSLSQMIEKNFKTYQDLVEPLK